MGRRAPAAVGDFIARAPRRGASGRRARSFRRDARIRRADAFAGLYRLAELRRATEPVWHSVDVLIVPTLPRPRRVAEVIADPIRPNSELGTYTNFVNLLDLCALAIPGRCAMTDSRQASRSSRRPGLTIAWPISVRRSIHSSELHRDSPSADRDFGLLRWLGPHIALQH